MCSSNIRYGTYRIVPRCIDINDTVKACCSLWIDRNVGVTGRKGGVGRRRGRRRGREKARAGFMRSLCFYACVCVWMFCGMISPHRESAPGLR